MRMQALQLSHYRHYGRSGFVVRMNKDRLGCLASNILLEDVLRGHICNCCMLSPFKEKVCYAIPLLALLGPSSDDLDKF